MHTKDAKKGKASATKWRVAVVHDAAAMGSTLGTCETKKARENKPNAKQLMSTMHDHSYTTTTNIWQTLLLLLLPIPIPLSTIALITYMNSFQTMQTPNSEMLYEHYPVIKWSETAAWRCSSNAFKLWFRRSAHRPYKSYRQWGTGATNKEADAWIMCIDIHYITYRCLGI